MTTQPLHPDPPGRPRARSRILLASSIVSAVFFGNLLLYLCNEYQPVARSAELSADPRVVSLSAVDAGAEVPFGFRIMNTTRGAVTITDATTSCGCTVLDPLKGVRLEAGRYLEVRGKLSTSGRRGKWHVDALVEYRTEAPVLQRQLVLGINAVVRPVIRVSPEALRVASGPAGAGDARGIVYLDSAREPSFSVVEVRPSAPWLKVEVVRNDFRRGGKPIEFRVSVDADRLPEDSWLSPIGEQSIHVRTTSPSERDLTIPVRVARPESGRG